MCASRISLIQNQLKSSSNIVDSALDYYQIQDFLTPKEDLIRNNVRDFLEKEITPFLDEYVEKCEFPEFVLKKLAGIDLLNHYFKAPYGNPLSDVGIGALTAELFRCDGSLGLWVLIQTFLVGATIEMHGSEEQKKKFLPKLRKMELLGGWGLTEDKFGSDASSLSTTASKTENGYKLNGNKRWIGMANRDILVTWAKNIASDKVECFIVETNTPGYSYSLIKHKLPMRLIPNCQVYLNNVLVPEQNKLPKATDFQNGTSLILKRSRTFICWGALGLAVGAYDRAIRYATTRKQFGKPISSFQLVQEKLSRMMTTINAMLLVAWRTSKLAEKSKHSSHALIAGSKSWNTLKAREVCYLAREIMGGNGILHDNYAMKALADIEVLITGEGTYEINSLLHARELTGFSAFKK